VYVWFGLLKILGISPVAGLVKDTYPMLPQPSTILLLGFGEILIGLLLLHPRTLKTGLILMWLQMGGIFTGVLLNPSVYFSSSNPLMLTINGEFVVKNLVLLAAGYALWKKE